MVEMPALPFGNVQPFTGEDLGGSVVPIRIGIGNPQQQGELLESLKQGDTAAGDSPHFIVDPTAFRPDQTLIVSGAPIGPGSPFAPTVVDNPAGGTEMKVRVAEGEVEPCEPVPVSASSTQIRAPQGD